MRSRNAGIEKFMSVESIVPTEVCGLSQSDRMVWRHYLRATMAIAEALEKQLGDDHGLSLNEYEVMVVLSEQPGHTIRMSELAEELVNSRSRLTHTIRRMEQRGLVERTQCKQDGRGVNCTLTLAGELALNKAAPDHQDAVRQNIFDRLSLEELDQFGKILAKLGV